MCCYEEFVSCLGPVLIFIRGLDVIDCSSIFIKFYFKNKY